MNRTVKQKRSKAIDMRYYWLQDRVDQGQFKVHWRPGTDDKADYFTKHHSAAHHIEMRETYLQPTSPSRVASTHTDSPENTVSHHPVP